MTWNYAAGKEMIGASAKASRKRRAVAQGDLSFRFRTPSSRQILTEIAALRPDAVFAFFAGAGAVKFVKDYAESGLKARVPLYGAGFLTDGTAAGLAAFGYGLWEKNQFVLREETLPILPAGQDPFRILHLSDIHFVPGQDTKAQWLRPWPR